MDQTGVRRRGESQCYAPQADSRGFGGRAHRLFLLLVASMAMAMAMGCSGERTTTGPMADGGMPPLGSTAFLTAGARHACAIFGGGAVRCWGANDSGQLGRPAAGDPLASYSVDLGTGRRATAVFAGLNHTCAILENGAVKCWGLNSFGQLGLGDEVNRGDGQAALGDALPEVDLGTGRRAVALAVGGSATCALLDDGLVKCWGDAYQGALGYGDIDTRGTTSGSMGDNLPVVDLGNRDGRALKAKQIAAIDYHSFCAILDEGNAANPGGRADGSSPGQGDGGASDGNSGLKCWGSNDYCELAIGTREGGRGGEPGTMGNNLPYIDLGTTASGMQRKAVQIAGGFQFVCVLANDGVVKCWGDNNGGQLGLGVTGSPRSCLPEELGDAGLVALPGPAVEISARGLSDGAGAHACARLATGAVICWGENGFGQLGIGDTVARTSPSPALDFGAGFVPATLRLGNDYSCALSTEARVKCWGNDASGQLGSEPRAAARGATSVLSPTAAGADIRMRGRAAHALAAGEEHTCAILTGGALKCWGGNSKGQLGLGDRANRGDATGLMGEALPLVSFGAPAVRVVAAGARHTCAVLDSGAATCWGDNANGQLGRADVTELLAPGGPLPLTGKAIAIAAGADFTCALSDRGQITCFGDNARGQLGRGDSQAHGGSFFAVVVSAPAAALAAGDRHACALLSDGRTVCWGANDQGQLGMGDVRDRSRPTVLTVSTQSGTAAVAAIAARGNVTCALLVGGQVTCWGANDSGQLGRGDAWPLNQPPRGSVDLGSGRTAVALGVGGGFACSVLDTRQAKCWGDNRLQQLGARLTGPAYGDGPSELGDFLPVAYQGGGRSVDAVASGHAHTCAILDTGDVRCWGDNSVGQLGVGDSIGHALGSSPTTVVDLGGEP